MSLTVEEYRERWEGRDAFDSSEQTITPTACVLSGSYLASAPGISDTFYVFKDFGDAVGFCRYPVLDEEIRDFLKAKTPQEKVAALQKEAGDYFDELLERFVRNGYQPEMSGELLDGIEKYFDLYRLDHIFVLPDDLGDLLDYSGNPFKYQWAIYAEDDWGEDEEDQRYKAKFDLNNPEHCDALFYRLYEMIA